MYGLSDQQQASNAVDMEETQNDQTIKTTKIYKGKIQYVDETNKLFIDTVLYSFPSIKCDVFLYQQMQREGQCFLMVFGDFTVLAKFNQTAMQTWFKYRNIQYFLG